MRDMKILPIRHVMIYFAYICVPFIGRIAKDGELYSRAYNSGESPPPEWDAGVKNTGPCVRSPFSPQVGLDFDCGTVRFVRLLPIRISYPDHSHSHSHPGWFCACK